MQIIAINNYILGKIESEPNIVQYQVHRKLEGNKTSEYKRKERKRSVRCKLNTFCPNPQL